MEHDGTLHSRYLATELQNELPELTPNVWNGPAGPMSSHDATHGVPHGVPAIGRRVGLDLYHERQPTPTKHKRSATPRSAGIQFLAERRNRDGDASRSVLSPEQSPEVTVRLANVYRLSGGETPDACGEAARRRH